MKTIDDALSQNEWSKIRNKARQTTEQLNWINIVENFAQELHKAYQEILFMNHPNTPNQP